MGHNGVGRAGVSRDDERNETKYKFNFNFSAPFSSDGKYNHVSSAQIIESKCFELLISR